MTVGTALGVLANDTDPENDTLSAALVSNVQNGTLNLSADGSFTYTPNDNFSGTDTFTYSASDGASSSNTATATITVTAVNDAPIASADSFSLNASDTLVVTDSQGVLVNDTDADGDSLQAVWFPPRPMARWLSIRAVGSLTLPTMALVAAMRSCIEPMMVPPVERSHRESACSGYQRILYRGGECGRDDHRHRAGEQCIG